MLSIAKRTSRVEQAHGEPTMKFVEYLDNAARLKREAAEIEEPNFRALLLRQAEVYQQLRNERLSSASGAENRTDRTPAPTAGGDG